MSKIIEYLPKMKTSDELIESLRILPEYSENICDESSVV